MKKLLCSHCIEAIRSRGESVYIGKMKYTADEAEANNITCDWCNEYDDLYEVVFTSDSTTDKRKNYNIVCNNADKPEIFEALRTCGIEFESSFYCDGKSYISMSCTDAQALQYEIVISSSDSDRAMIEFYVNFCDAIVSLDRKGWMIEDVSRIERFDSFDDMVEGIRYTVRQWEDEGIIQVSQVNGITEYRSLID